MIVEMRVLVHDWRRSRRGLPSDRASDCFGDAAAFGHERPESFEGDRLVAVAPGVFRARVHFDDQSVGAGGAGGTCLPLLDLRRRRPHARGTR